MYGVSIILENFGPVDDWIRVMLFVAVFFIAEPLCTSLGGTPGNYIKGIRVRQHSHPQLKLNFFQALIRYLIKSTMGWLSFITINTNLEKRAIHDMAAGSVVVKL